VCYLRLNKLKKDKYLDLIYIELIGGFCWGLTSKGFEVIKDRLPELKTYGFKSEHKHHDFWVNFCHQGPFLDNEIKDYALISEQQLRCYENSYFPEWIPSGELHRSDGYWIYKSENERKLISLEVELSQKSFTKFEETLSFYRHQQEINSVIWVCDNQPFLKRLKNKVLSSVNPSNQKHYFFNLNDLKENFWCALEKYAETNKKSFGEIILNQTYTKPIQELSKGSMTCIRDLRKKPN
jgi:hypothetical protein